MRLDSGDLLELSGRVREVLDGAGLPGVTIFASGNLDEHEIARLLAGGAPIDGFGVGSRLAVSDGAPSIDLVYKLVDFDGRPVLKLSADKATLPGPKQVWRRLEDGRFAGDVIGLADEEPPAGPSRCWSPRRPGRDTLEPPPGTQGLLEPATAGSGTLASARELLRLRGSASRSAPAARLPAVSRRDQRRGRCAPQRCRRGALREESAR